MQNPAGPGGAGGVNPAIVNPDKVKEQQNFRLTYVYTGILQPLREIHFDDCRLYKLIFGVRRLLSQNPCFLKLHFVKGFTFTLLKVISKVGFWILKKYLNGAKNFNEEIQKELNLIPQVVALEIKDLFDQAQNQIPVIHDTPYSLLKEISEELEMDKDTFEGIKLFLDYVMYLDKTYQSSIADVLHACISMYAIKESKQVESAAYLEKLETKITNEALVLKVFYVNALEKDASPLDCKC